MNLEEFKSEYFEQDKIFQSKINPDFSYTEIASQQSLFVSNLIHRALESEDKDQIIDFIAFLIYAGSTQEVLAVTLHGYLNDKAIPIINNQENFNVSLKSANSTLSMIIEKNTLARQKGASIAHQKTDEYKKEIINNYKNNKASFDSKDIAAIHYTKTYPLEFSTIRNYLKNQ